jgi:hypothetical protein
MYPFDLYTDSYAYESLVFLKIKTVNMVGNFTIWWQFLLSLAFCRLTDVLENICKLIWYVMSDIEALMNQF